MPVVLLSRSLEKVGLSTRKGHYPKPTFRRGAAARRHRTCAFVNPILRCCLRIGATGKPGYRDR